MHLNGDIFRMDPYYVLLFLAFGIIFGIAGTLIVYAARYLPVDRRAVGMAVFFCGCATCVYYNAQMPPVTSSFCSSTSAATGFLIHPLFFAAGVLVISGFSRYLTCLRKETIFSALFVTAGIAAVLGGMGSYIALSSVTGESDFAIIHALLRGIVDASLAAVIFTGACEVYFLIQKKGRAACAGGMKKRESPRQVLDLGEMHSKRLK